MDALREMIATRSAEMGFDYKSLSKRLGKNDAYIHQFLNYGKPSKLPEGVRAALAELLELDETLLGAPLKANRKNQPSEQGDLFRLREVDLRAGANPGGGVDDGQWVEPSADGSSYAHRAVADWMLPKSYAQQELSLSFGQADILPVKGDSMDDGTNQGLISGDRVIVDLTDVDARQGAIFAVWDGGGVIIKQVEIVRGSDPVQIVCKSLNRRYDPIPLILDGNVHIIGRIAAKISRM